MLQADTGRDLFHMHEAPPPHNWYYNSTSKVVACISMTVDISSVYPDPIFACWGECLHAGDVSELSLLNKKKNVEKVA